MELKPMTLYKAESDSEKLGEVIFFGAQFVDGVIRTVMDSESSHTISFPVVRIIENSKDRLKVETKNVGVLTIELLSDENFGNVGKEYYPPYKNYNDVLKSVWWRK